MLTNLWYVACHGADVETGQPKKAKVLGQNLALFRTESGELKALSNICIHRGGALANGKQHGDEIACPYHGWRFNGEGKCTLIPSLGADAAIPKRARVDAYPVEEKYGFVWVYMGDLDESERPSVPDLLPEYDDENWRCVTGAFPMKANWQRATENSLDTAHVHFVHPMFGTPEAAVVDGVPVEQREWGAITSHKFEKAKEKEGALKELLKDRKKGPETEMEFNMHGLCIRLLQKMSPVVHQIMFSCRTPVDAEHTISFWIQARNYKLDPSIDEERIRGVEVVLEQDKEIVEEIEPILVPDGMADELSVASDEMPVAFRRWVKRLEDKGWAIDLMALPQPGEPAPAHVVPSPERGRDPKNWVFKAVPRKPAAAQDEVAQAAE